MAPRHIMRGKKCFVPCSPELCDCDLSAGPFDGGFHFPTLEPKPMMTMSQVEEAGRVAKDIRRHDELAAKYLAYPRIEFINGANYVSSVGCQEMDETDIALMQKTLRHAAETFFAGRRQAFCDKLRALGVEPEPAKETTLCD